MCGIAGYVLLGGNAQLDRIRAMCGVIRHRGPDDEGFHLDGACALGVRRLSIIDVAGGHQPISNEDGSAWVVLNGEIYNHCELRADLIRRGHRFLTKTDTEVLVHLYEEEGAAAIGRLRGMFAYAIWDARRRELFLGRDRLGKKPLYYAVLEQGLFFGSEISCLREAGVPAEIDAEALKLYFQFSYIPDPRTIYKAVRKLSAGHWMTYDLAGRLRQKRYWAFPTPAANTTVFQTEEEAAEQVRAKFDEAVRIRMMADVPLGAFLSGGLDSSSVVSSMARQSADPVATFSAGFDVDKFNELPYAGLVAREYRTEHHQVVVRSDMVTLIPQLASHFGEPFGDSASILTYILSKFAAGYVKVVLSGDGGDEIFAGYDSFLTAWEGRLDRIPRGLRRYAEKIGEWLPYFSYGKNFLRALSRPTALERYFEFNYAPHALRERLLEPDWMLPADAGFLRRTLTQCLLPENADLLSQIMYFEGTANLTSGMLVRVDRMAMAASLEVRCPLLDHELVELAVGLPHHWKISAGKGKQILRKALGPRLPVELLKQRKKGFAAPLAKWFRGELKEFLWDHLTSAQFLGRGIVSGSFLRRLLEEHQSGRRDNEQWLWSLLMLETWFVENERFSNDTSTLRHS